MLIISATVLSFSSVLNEKPLYVVRALSSRQCRNKATCTLFGKVDNDDSTAYEVHRCLKSFHASGIAVEGIENLSGGFKPGIPCRVVEVVSCVSGILFMMCLLIEYRCRHVSC